VRNERVRIDETSHSRSPKDTSPPAPNRERLPTSAEPRSKLAGTRQTSQVDPARRARCASITSAQHLAGRIRADARRTTVSAIENPRTSLHHRYRTRAQSEHYCWLSLGLLLLQALLFGRNRIPADACSWFLCPRYLSRLQFSSGCTFPPGFSFYALGIGLAFTFVGVRKRLPQTGRFLCPRFRAELCDLQLRFEIPRSSVSMPSVSGWALRRMRYGGPRDLAFCGHLRQPYCACRSDIPDPGPQGAGQQVLPRRPGPKTAVRRHGCAGSCHDPEILASWMTCARIAATCRAARSSSESGSRGAAATS
jgi:hypothetical protein